VFFEHVAGIHFKHFYKIFRHVKIAGFKRPRDCGKTACQLLELGTEACIFLGDFLVGRRSTINFSHDVKLLFTEW